jgi:hypothetical protein
MHVVVLGTAAMLLYVATLAPCCAASCTRAGSVLQALVVSSDQS